MRAGIVAIFFFVTLLALGHYVAAPFFCRSGLPIMGLDPRALCSADMHFNRAGSVLLYFSTIGIALIAGVIAGFTAGRTKAASAEEKSESSHVETFEQIVAAEEMKAAAKQEAEKTGETAAETPKADEKSEDKKLEDKKPDAIAADEKKPDAAKSEADNPEIKKPEEKKEAEKSELPPSATLPPVAHPSALAFHAATAPAPAAEPKAESKAELKVEPKVAAEVEPKPELKREESAVVPAAALSNPGEAAVAAAILPGFDAKPAVPAEPKPVTPPVESGPAASTLATAEAISIGLAVARTAPHRNFDGTNEELLERFRELKKQEGVNAIAQAQRLLDESTLSALSKGGDPKQHLSQIAHLVLAEDPDLKSGVVRGVVVHIAARLKELGIAKPNLPGTTKGAA